MFLSFHNRIVYLIIKSRIVQHHVLPVKVYTQLTCSVIREHSFTLKLFEVENKFNGEYVDEFSHKFYTFKSDFIQKS